ncbi:MAG: hydrogenase subunit MbhD domain-containing protein [Xanthobacteraceae bacterium]
MSAAFAFDLLLAGIIPAIAVWTLAARSTFAAAVVFVVYGLMLALVWVRLNAVDVALTEAAIGGGVTGMLLLGAAARLRATGAHGAPARPLKILAGIACGLVTAGLAGGVLSLPLPPATLAPLVMAKLADSGLGNPVTGVLFVYRSLDTLLEKVVVLLALLGVWSLAPDRLWGGVPGLPLYPKPSPILTLLVQVMTPIGFLMGVYLCWTGADHPGGAFQGGAVLAAMWIIVMTSGLRPVPPIGQTSVRWLAAVGPIVFFAIGLAGAALAGAFLAYPAGFAKPLIVAIELTLTLSIGVTLGLLAAGPPARTVPR